MISAEAAEIRAGIERERPDGTLTPQRERNAWVEAVADLPIVPGVVEQLVEVGEVAGRRLRPSKDTTASTASAAAPVVWCHGGGLTIGSSLTHREFAARLALAAGCDVFVPDYRLLPEHEIGGAISDVNGVLDALGGDVILGGDSTGAALALTCMLDRLDRGELLPRRFVSLSGAFDATLSGRSFDEGLDPQLDRVALGPWQHTVASVCELDDPRLSPLLRAGLSDGLPPMLLLAGSDEVWRSDSERLTERLHRSGNEAELHIVEGMWHVWPMWGTFPEGENAIQDIADFL